MKFLEALLFRTRWKVASSYEPAIDRRVPDDAITSAYETLVGGPAGERRKSALVTEMRIEHVGDMKQLAAQQSEEPIGRE